MISALLAAGLLVVSEPVLTPDQLAETLLAAGACGAAGWQSANEGAGDAFVVAVAAQHPELTPQQFREALLTAIPAAQARIFGDPIADRASYSVWADGFGARCDAITTAHPEILSRLPDTDARWGEERAAFMLRLSE